MTDDFDFDFDVDRGRSASRTEHREPKDKDSPGNGTGRELPDLEYDEGEGHRGNGRANGSRGIGSRANGRTNGNRNGSRRFAPSSSPDPDEGDWLSLGDDDFEPGSRSPLRERHDGPAGPPTPGEARNFAKEARRRASRRPSPILDLDEERARLEREDAEEEDVDFESMLSRQPQKSGVARRGSAIRHALQGGIQSLRRVGGERISESRDRVQALRERVPTRIPQPGTADVGGAGKPPPPRLPRRISSRRPRKPKPGRIKKLRLLILLLGLGLLAIVSTFFGMMMAISQDLPQLENKKEFAEAKNSEVFDDQGNKIGALLNNNKRILVDSDEISPYMKQAAVAIEDKRFYEHGGVDLQGMVRAGLQDILPGGSTQGASTITEQFVKNALEAQGEPNDLREVPRGRARHPARAPLDQGQDPHRVPEHHLLRRGRIRDRGGRPHLLRQELAREGHPCGGSGEDPCAKVLTPPEAAMLAGIIASPSAFSPRANPQAATDRRNLVLQKMLDQGDISEEEYNGPARGSTRRSRRPRTSSTRSTTPSPRTSPPGCASRWSTSTAPAARSAAGLEIHSSLDLDMQNTAQEIAQRTLAGIAPTASVVVLDNKTGEIKAMVGGNDYERYPFNMATNGHRQPGSTFKPFTLATALSQGISPNTSYASNEKIFKVPGSKHEYFDVHNYNDKYFGSSSLYDATLHSDNSVYSELALGRTDRCVQGCGGSPAVRGGTKRIAHTAHEMGIETDFSTNPSMVLGAIDPGVTPLEMAHAYETIATDGERVGGNLDTSPGPNNAPRTSAPSRSTRSLRPTVTPSPRTSPRRSACSRRASRTR